MHVAFGSRYSYRAPLTDRRRGYRVVRRGGPHLGNLVRTHRVVLIALTLLVTLVVARPTTAQTGWPSGDRDALVTLYNATDGPNWVNNTNWLSDEPLDTWYGVTTNAGGRVNGLRIRENWLRGKIPLELGKLTGLTVLDLSYNQLSGWIPPELASLSSLGSLDLGVNRLNGEIPSELGSLSKLRGLFLNDNQLSGKVPSELGSLSGLRGLYLSRNRLSGEIPTELGSLSKLTSLGLQGNQLSGKIPPELGSLSNLKELYLSRNRLSGNVPLEFGRLSNLLRLYIDGNELTGAIPPELASLSKLRWLFLHDNQLSGTLPQSLTRLSALEDLIFQDNAGLCAPAAAAFQQWLSGIPDKSGDVCDSDQAPTDRHALAALYNASDGQNWINRGNWLSEEPLDTWYGVTTDARGRVTELRLSKNRLSGGIPPELGTLSSLRVLQFTGNRLSGAIPPELGTPFNLTSLSLESNQLSGTIPPELANLSNLTLLRLQGNQLSGPLPESLTRLLRLEELLFQDNAGLCVSGDSVFQEWLNDIPKTSGDVCTSDQTSPDRGALVALYNAANGPNWRNNTNWLTDTPLYAWHGVNTDVNGRVTKLALSRNWLSGEIPPELGTLSNLRVLNLAANQLSGKIPP